MLIYFTDAITKQQIAINPTYVTAVFELQEGEHLGKTVISLVGGTLIIDESLIDAVGALQGQLK